MHRIGARLPLRQSELPTTRTAPNPIARPPVSHAPVDSTEETLTRYRGAPGDGHPELAAAATRAQGTRTCCTVTAIYGTAHSICAYNLNLVGSCGIGLPVFEVTLWLTHARATTPKT
jgi:hypothetical protein